MAMYYYARKLQKSASSSSSSSYSSSQPKANKNVSQCQRTKETSNRHLPCCSLTRPHTKYESLPVPLPHQVIHITGSTLSTLSTKPTSTTTNSINHSDEAVNHMHDNHTNTSPKGVMNYDQEDHLLHNGVFGGTSQLMRGSMEDVMEVLVPTESHFPNPDVLFAFLLSARLTTPPHQLLHRIFRRFYKNTLQNHRQEPSSAVEEDIEESDLDEDRVHLLVKFVRMWTELLPHDFRDDRMMHFVRIIARICININPEVREDVSQLLANLLSKLTALEVYEGNLGRIRTEASIGEPIAAPSVVTICPNPVTMAEQLTLVELERFSHIGAQEFVSQLLQRGRHRMGGSESCDTKNLDAFIAWFKRLSIFVASETCKMSKKKSRCRVIEYWIQVGRECFRIRNFNSLMAILAGLNIPPVARLKKTWGKICCAELIELQTAMDPDNNFSAYRTMYKTAVWEALRGLEETHNHNYRIIVPYFSLLQRDVFNLNSAYSTVPDIMILLKMQLTWKLSLLIFTTSSFSNGDINVEKFHLLAKLVKEIVSWQSIDCPFVKIQPIFNAVQALPIFNDDELMDASYHCEDPETFEEKEEFNKLRRDHGTVPLVSCNSSSEHLYHV